jgi:hypothetical protein
MIEPRRVERERNMARFYSLDVVVVPSTMASRCDNARTSFEAPVTEAPVTVASARPAA